MPKLSIQLRDGFAGDTVVVRAGGSEVLRRDGVTTDLRISRAADVDTEVPVGPIDVQIELPQRGLVHQTVVTVDGPTFLLVDVENGRILARPTGDEQEAYSL